MRRKITSLLIILSLLGAYVAPAKAEMIIVSTTIGTAVAIGGLPALAVGGAMLGTVYAASHWDEVTEAAKVAAAAAGRVFTYVFGDDPQEKRKKEQLQERRNDEERRARRFAEVARNIGEQDKAFLQKTNTFASEERPHTVLLSFTNQAAAADAERFSRIAPSFASSLGSSRAFRTPVSSPQFRKLQDSNEYQQAASDYISTGNVTYHKERTSLLTMATIGLGAADTAAATGQMSASDEYLSSVNDLIDSVFSYENLRDQVSRGSTFVAGVIAGALDLPPAPLRGYESTFALGKATGAAMRMAGDVFAMSLGAAVDLTGGAAALISGGALSPASAVAVAGGSTLIVTAGYDMKVHAQKFQDSLKEWKQYQSLSRAEPPPAESNIKLNPSETPVFRGGSDMTIKPREVKLDANGKVLPWRGVSLDTDASSLARFGGGKQIKHLPDELQIVQRGRATHYEIIPKEPMSLERFQELLNQIKFH